MKHAALRPHAALSSTLQPASTNATTATTSAQLRYLTNDEAAAFLRLSLRTLEKQRVIGGGARFRKFGQRMMYALSDLEAWADAHPRVHLHFTPTSASWINLVECWFSVLTARRLKRGRFRSTRALGNATTM